MANCTPIKRLPVELITEVFETLDDIADVAHLARTSRFFSDIWKLHAVTICRAILPRMIPSYEKVNELADALIQQDIRDEGPYRIYDLNPYPTFEDSPFNKARVTVCLSRAFALQIKESEYIHNLDGPERSHVIDLYHELWMLTKMPRALAKATLRSVTPSQLSPLDRFGSLWILLASDVKKLTMEDITEYWKSGLKLLSRWFDMHFPRLARDVWHVLSACTVDDSDQ